MTLQIIKQKNFKSF